MMRRFLLLMVLPFMAGQVLGVDALVYQQVSRRTLTDALGRPSTSVLHQTVYASRHALRTETVEFDPVTIMRLDEGRIYQYDPVKKIYAVASVESLGREAEARKELLRACYDMMSRPKKERLAVVLGKVRARAKVLEEGRNIFVAGYRTRKLAFYENGRLRMEVWLTDAFDSKTDITPLLAATGEFSGALLKLRRRERGFALKSRVHPVLEINPTVENEISTIARKDVPDDLFTVPAGFRRVTSLDEIVSSGAAPVNVEDNTGEPRDASLPVAGGGGEGEGGGQVPEDEIEDVPLPR